MAIYHLHTKHVKHSDGRTAVAAAAYRAAEKLQLKSVDKETGKERVETFDYRKKRGVIHTEIVLPPGVVADWAKDRETLWNEAEKKDTRKNSRTAREVVVALPHELNEEQRLELTRAFALYLGEKYGVAVDFAIHDPTSAPVKKANPNEETEEHPPNYHAHLLMTTRVIEENGFGKKSIFELTDGWLKQNGYPTGPQQVENLREIWANFTNEYLFKAGHDVRTDHRSHKDRGFKVEPTKHVGVHATAMQRRGIKIERDRLSEEEKKYNADLIYTDPKELLRIITTEHSVFTRRDIARTVHRYVDDKYFQPVFESVMTCSDLVQLQAEAVSDTGARIPARYSTWEMIDIETRMMANAKSLAEEQHRIRESKVQKAIAKQNKKLAKIGGKLTDQQCEAIEHITMSARITAVVGRAGAGKSTMLEAARIAWEQSGYRVVGVALAGKASSGLEKSAGIQSRTLASLEYGLKKGHIELTKKDVLVLDEAGMIDSRQLSRIISYVEKTGAKLVMVGDPEQLQPIGPGGAFRAVVEEIGAAHLDEIRRQKSDWQKKATKCFSTGQTKQALEEYNFHGKIRVAGNHMHAIRSIVDDYLVDMAENKSATRLALAHRRKDVKKLNAAIRTALQVTGQIPPPGDNREVIYQTKNGARAFAWGDRIVFSENDNELGVRNGMLATVQKVNKNFMQVELDDGGRVVIPMQSYQSVDYGYATTIHKSQGSTVDRTFVLASTTMDKHLAYVAMSRHRDDAKMYVDEMDFRNLNELAGKLSRDHTKETTSDWLAGFSGRRGMDHDFFEDAPRNRWRGQTNSDSTSKRDAAIDYFAMAWEEFIWFEMHNLDAKDIPTKKLGKAKGMLEKQEAGLWMKLRNTISSNPEKLRRIVIELNGQERVDGIENAMQSWKNEAREQPKSKKEQDDAKPNFGRTNNPGYEYKPRF